MIHRFLLLVCLLFGFGHLQAQNFTPATERVAAQEKLKTQSSWLKNIPMRSIGPTIMSGRVVDLAVNPDNPNEFLVAYASGGLWHTNTNGNSFEPLFQDQNVMTIGDIAVNWSESTIWLGSGENNSSRSSYAGDGMYVSFDMGKTWEHKGLTESHHIGRIILHPADKNTLWVASLGHLYSKNEERGLYKTTDGGKTWNKTLFVDENTGVVDLAMHPSSTDVLYAATWQRHREAWNFEEGGKGSGIYRSDDGGETWTRLNTTSSGFPMSEGVGRIGLATSKAQPDWIYASLDNQERRPKEANEENAPTLTKDAILVMQKDDFMKISESEIEEFLKENRFPKKYSVEYVKKEIEAGNIEPKALVEFLQDANSLLFDTPVKGLELYLSKDKGKTWQKTHEGYVDDVVYSYGYYFGQVRASDANADKVYLFGVPIIKSTDGGKTFESISADNVHADHHALWINPKNDNHIINGNDGGVNISYDDGKSWFKANSTPVGQFYTVATDRAKPYNVYGGLQDNGVWTASNQYKYSDSWQQEGQYPYKRLLGGDGMQVEIDFRDNSTIFTCYQFGNCYKVNKNTMQSDYITPSHELGERPYRFNWQTPLHLSRHQPDILYMGSNRIHRSFDQGKNWETISDDLTRGGKKGDVPYGTLTSIHESPMRFGLLYAGSDDGLVHISKDAGYTWENISDNLPETYANFWVSRVQASAHQEGRVYVSLNGYRFDNFEALVFRSDDFGKTWTRLGTDLPLEPVNVIKEDSKEENLLFVGTDHDLYASLDGGISFMPMGKEFPRVAVHDLSIQPEEDDLVVGTHGRSLFVADIKPLQMMTREMAKQKENKLVFLQNPASTKFNKNWGNTYWSKWYGAYEPEQTFVFFSPKSQDVRLSLVDKSGNTLHSEKMEAKEGINYWTYDMSIDEKAAKELASQLSTKDKEVKAKKADNGNYYVLASEYQLELSTDGQKVTLPFSVKAK